MSNQALEESFRRYVKNMLLVCKNHGYINRHPYGAREDYKYCPYCGSILLEPSIESQQLRTVSDPRPSRADEPQGEIRNKQGGKKE